VLCSGKPGSICYQNVTETLSNRDLAAVVFRCHIGNSQAGRIREKPENLNPRSP